MGMAGDEGFSECIKSVLLLVTVGLVGNRHLNGTGTQAWEQLSFSVILIILDDPWLLANHVKESHCLVVGSID